MASKVLIFRTDRIGDLIVTCPAIITIKKYFQKSEITLITSSRNHDYAKNLNIFDHIYKFPRSNIIRKIRFIYKLALKKFDYIFVYDGKERSIISAALINSKYKIALTPKVNFYYKMLKIKFLYDNEETNLNKIFQQSLNYCKINTKINNYNFLINKKNNNFSSEIPIKNYIHIHLDEKWIYDLYIKTYTYIDPNYHEFIEFLYTIAKKNHILITTGTYDFELINALKNNFFKKKNDKIFFKENINNSIYFIYKPTFDDIESLLRNSKILIACHGAITHAANSFDIKNIDIQEKSRAKFYKRFTAHLKNHHLTHRCNFDILKKSLLNIIEK